MNWILHIINIKAACEANMEKGKIIAHQTKRMKHERGNGAASTTMTTTNEGAN